MENKTSLTFFLALLLSRFIAQITAKKHIFSNLIDNEEIDTSLFDASQLFHGDKLLYSQQGLKENDKITILPGQPEGVTFNQYSGYVTVDQNTGRAFHYYFVEAHHSADTLPLLLWLNGGPGCSSLGYGAMSELGPFRVLSDGKTLVENHFSWNYAANVLFLESPAGVGFSYSNTTADANSNGDRKTAKDNYAFLVNWLDRFPEYKQRDFYIAGESYAGHYVPQLAQTILHQNEANKTTINFKGIIIGNADINYETDTKGELEYLGSHALISDDVARQALKDCNFSPEAKKQPQKCREAVGNLNPYENVGNINPYNIYAPLCSNPNLTDKPKKISSAMSPDPCTDGYVQAYLNRPDVQKALHVIPCYWEFCSDDVYDKWVDSASTVIPLIKEIMANGIRVWIYSGDVDGVVPVTSTQMSIKKMELYIITPWHPWYIDEEIGGYTQVYKNLTFATVRGAGHDVPMYEPKRSLSLIMHFLAGTPLPNSSRN